MDQEASFTFTTPLNVNIVEIKGVEQTFVEGDISTTDIDFVNDIMSKKCQESMMKQILDRNMKLDLEHEAFKGKTTEEKEISKTKIPAGKLIDATVKKLGEDRYSTRVKGQINRNRADYKAIQGNLVEEYLDAFSVAFLPTEVKYEEKEGEQIRVLDDCILLNVALTGNPCNTKAQLVEVFTKSMDALEEYKKKKAIDPSVENSLVVKDNKENPLSFIWGKVYMGKPLDKKELKLLKSALDVTDNKGTEAILAKEYYSKLTNGEKLTNKEYWTFKELIQIDYQDEGEVLMSAKDKSHLTPAIKTVGNSELNLPKNSIKMTDKKTDEELAAEAKAKADAEAKANEGQEGEQTKMLKSVSENLKTLSDKYVGLKEENATIKEDMKAISENLTKVVKALEQPIHKSSVIGMSDAEKKAELGATAEEKSVDPLSLFN